MCCDCCWFIFNELINANSPPSPSILKTYLKIQFLCAISCLIIMDHAINLGNSCVSNHNSQIIHHIISHILVLPFSSVFSELSNLAIIHTCICTVGPRAINRFMYMYWMNTIQDGTCSLLLGQFSQLTLALKQVFHRME